MLAPTFTVRVARPDDSRALGLLAQLTGRSRPQPGTALLAERDGAPLAAIRMTSGTVLADPDNTPPHLVRSLRFTRYRILRQGGQTGPARSLLSLPMRSAVVSAQPASS